ncbi:TRZ/ATZ family hydrolase [Simiduia aestuariiviva]|uniref:5-methylthioadenosine/S-adenosylhomocysteine deaminase n=1 Tax=Simiduia aestuariiviva TaxID=1510459 RepID=A0A839UPG6_9GAMM|nr:TRZ/ATZ family hydrolase [Simiduia aestuariiviva]MBB3168389.1 5-methylthioadenosine/S-adenosylhomocysteine deaminase [Simiduia aestuariiviva]
MAKIDVDTLISARWIAPVDIDRDAILEGYSIAIKGDRIEDICPTNEASAKFNAKETLDLPEHVIIPGLINAHGHAAMSLLRGFADDLPLKPWLEEHIWPAEGKHVSAPFVRDGTELAIAEMLLGGTTCFSDMYFFPEAAIEAVEQSGMRAQICIPIMDFPTPWASTPEEYLAKGESMLQQLSNHNRIGLALGPHAPYTVGDETFTRLVDLADKYQRPIQVHLHETDEEVASSLASLKVRPTERLESLGVLTHTTQCVHMTQIDETDMNILKRTGAHVVHCPESNMKLASGICPTATLLAADINTCIGTDGCASNNDLNMLGEMRTAALLGKVSAGDPAVLGAHTLLKMATLNGAKALGIDDIAGSLTIGKRADIAAIALDDLQFSPIYDPVAHLLYTDCAHKVSHVWVDGKMVVRERQLLTLDAAAIHARAKQWQATINQASQINE